MFCCISHKGKKRNPSQALRVKVTVVGDGECGKTSLIQRFCKGTLPKEYAPTLFDCSSLNITVDDHKQVQLVVQDTAGQTDLDQLRPRFYSNTDVVIICFSLDNPSSLTNVQKHWVPEVRRYCGRHVPIVLVATKADEHQSRLNAEKRSQDLCENDSGVSVCCGDLQERLFGFSSVFSSQFHLDSAGVSESNPDIASAFHNLVTEPTSYRKTDLSKSERKEKDISTTALDLTSQLTHRCSSSSRRNSTSVPRKSSRALSISTRCLVQEQDTVESDPSSSSSSQSLDSGLGSGTERTRPTSAADILASIQYAVAEEGRQVCKDLRAVDYCVTSSLRCVGVAETFQAAVGAAMASKQWRKKYFR